MSEPLEIPPSGTRGARTIWASFPHRLFKPFLNMQISRYRRATEPVAPKFLDFPLVLLTHRRGSHGPRVHAPARGFEQEDGTWLVVASKSGASTHPGWLFNLCKGPDNVWLEVGNRKLKVRPTLLKGKEREAALARVAAISPRYAEYQSKTDREIPIVSLKAY